MLPSPSLDTILDRMFARESNTVNRRLVSVLFSTPDTAVFDNLRHNIRYYNTRSGDAWDLAVAGYYAYGAREYDPDGVPVGIPTPHPGVDWWFSPREFNRLRQQIEDEHHRQVASRRGLPRRRQSWAYSGMPELVNFWVTGREPDWKSLKACVLTPEGPVAALGEVVETHSSWQNRELPSHFAPAGAGFPRFLDASVLEQGLKWAVPVAAGAALSQGVDALIELVNGVADWLSPK